MIDDRKSIWEAQDTMPTVSEITSPSLHGSQVYPQYPSDNRQIQQYRQAWIVEGLPEHETKNETKNETKTAPKNTNGPEKKDILTLLAVGTLIGLFICGIPLAVMSTLYLEAKSQSQTTSSTVSPETSETTGTTGTTGATTTTLPYQCTSYISNTDYTRNVGYTGGCCGNDNSLATGWYRFSGAAGTQLVTTPVNTYLCGSDYTGWFNGSLPTTVGGVTSGMECVNENGNICYLPYSVSSVLATNCGSYYVFYLTPMPTTITRYCTA